MRICMVSLVGSLCLFSSGIISSNDLIRESEQQCHVISPSNATLGYTKAVTINVTGYDQAAPVTLEVDYIIDDNCNGQILLVIGGMFFVFDDDVYFNFYTATCSQVNTEIITKVGQGTRFIAAKNVTSIWEKPIPDRWKNTWGGSTTWQDAWGSSSSFVLINLENILAHQPVTVDCMWNNENTNYRAVIQFYITGCPVEYYGEQCDQECNCTNGGECHTFHGYCICKPGYQGPICESACATGYYGPYCEMQCSCGFLQVCHHIKGCICDGPALLCGREKALIGGVVTCVIIVIIIMISIILIRHFQCLWCIWQTKRTYDHSEDIIYRMENQAGMTFPSSKNTVQHGVLDEYMISKWIIPEDKVFREQVLGEGAFGRVYKGQLMQYVPVDVAFKVVKNAKDPFAQRDLVSEFLTLVELGKHPNIVNLFGIVTSAQDDKVCQGLVLEYLEKGTLLGILKAQRQGLSSASPHEELPPKIFLKLVTDISAGMVHMSTLKLIHRDLAARNILISANLQAKIGDFGLSRDCYLRDLYKCKPEIGKKLPWFWMSPESLSENIYTTKSDVWSFGVLLWEICTLGHSPYTGIPGHALLSYLQSGKRLTLPASCPQEWSCVIQGCWSFHPAGRPKFKGLHEHFTALYLGDQGIPDFDTHKDDSVGRESKESCNKHLDNTKLHPSVLPHECGKSSSHMQDSGIASEC